MSIWSKINFNPNLNHNDSLTPREIERKVEERNAETTELAQKAYEAGGIPPSSAERAANHSSTTRQTNEAKKDRRDASIWWKSKALELDDVTCGNPASSAYDWREWEDDE